MDDPIQITIIGSPIACKEGVKEAWRDVAQWVFKRLHAKFGDQVATQYFDLFDTDCPQFPEGCQLPIVFVNADIISSGDKVSMPLIKKEIEALFSANY